MRVGLYARVSTLDKGQDTEVQLTDLRSYAEARGWMVVDEYVDKGQSGAKDRRPELDRLMRDARKRKIDLILCWRLDRLGRSLKHLILTLDELQGLGVGFVSYNESLDLTSSTGRLMFQLLGAFAEFERNMIRERVIAGLNHAKAKGKRLGRPGVDLDPMKLNEMRGQGLTMRTMADKLGVSLGLVHKTLSKCSPVGLDNSASKVEMATFN
jgi:DNA invertase Pin-like site-specific DNA recombinase